MYRKYPDKVYQRLIVIGNMISALVLPFIVSNVKMNKKYLGYTVSKNRKIFTGLTYKLLLSFTIISDVYRSFIPNKTTFSQYFLLRRFQCSTGALKSTELDSNW